MKRISERRDKQRKEKEAKKQCPDTTAEQRESSGNSVSLACEDALNQKPFVAEEPSGRRPLHEGDCMRIGKKTEVHVVRLPKDGDDVMVLNVTDRHGTRDEEVRLPIVAEGVLRRGVEGEGLGHGCEEDAQHSLSARASRSSSGAERRLENEW